MNEIEKFLRKLDKKRRLDVEAAIAQVEADQLGGFDVVKLAKREHEYRVRIGSVRIQFARTATGNMVTKVGFRNERT